MRNTALAGALTAPLLLSWDIDKHDTFHNAYLMIAAANFTVAFTPLLASSPQQDPGAGPGVTPVAAAPLMYRRSLSLATADHCWALV